MNEGMGTKENKVGNHYVKAILGNLLPFQETDGKIHTTLMSEAEARMWWAKCSLAQRKDWNHGDVAILAVQSSKLEDIKGKVKQDDLPGRFEQMSLCSQLEILGSQDSVHERNIHGGPGVTSFSLSSFLLLVPPMSHWRFRPWFWVHPHVKIYVTLRSLKGWLADSQLFCWYSSRKYFYLIKHSFIHGLSMGASILNVSTLLSKTVHGGISISDLPSYPVKAVVIFWATDPCREATCYFCTTSSSIERFFPLPW